MSQEVMRYTYHINSQQRSKGTNEEFYVDFTQIINKLATESTFIVQVHNIQIPFSFYQLSATSNLNQLPVYLKNAVDGVGIYSTITIPEGNYTPYTLITALNAALTTACQTPALGFTPFTPVFNTSYNPTTSKLTFVLTGPIGCQITLRFSFNSITALLGGFFGMAGNDVVMTTSTTPSSVQPCVLNPVNYLCLRSSLKQYRNREFITMKDDVSDILTKIPILTQQGTYIQWIEQSEPLYIIDSSINSIEFYLTNNLTYDPINLQGLPWSFTFSISEVLRPDYQSISTTQAINILSRMTQPAFTDEDIRALEQRRQEIFGKLDVYKEKLKPKVKEEKTEEKLKEKEPEVFKAERKDLSKWSEGYDASAKTVEYKTVVYTNMFEDELPPSEEEAPEAKTEPEIKDKKPKAKV